MANRPCVFCLINTHKISLSEDTFACEIHKSTLIQINIHRCRLTKSTDFPFQYSKRIIPVDDESFPIEKFLFVYKFYHLIIFENGIDAHKATEHFQRKYPGEEYSAFQLHNILPIIPIEYCPNGIKMGLNHISHRFVPLILPGDEDKLVQQIATYDNTSSETSEKSIGKSSEKSLAESLEDTIDYGSDKNTMDLE